MADATDVDLIETMMGRDLTDGERARAAIYIEFAEGEIESYLGRPIHPTQFEENAFPDADGAVYFKNTPCISLDAITVNGETKDLDAFTLAPYGLENVWEVYWNFLPFDIYHVNTDGVYGGKLVFTYTAGLDYPQAIKSLVVGAVINKLVDDVAVGNRESMGGAGVKMIQAEDYIIQWEGTKSSTLTTSSVSMFNSDADFKTIKRYKRIGVK